MIQIETLYYENTQQIYIITYSLLFFTFQIPNVLAFKLNIFTLCHIFTEIVLK